MFSLVELEGLNRLVSNCELPKVGSCSKCINRVVCNRTLKDNTPLEILRMLNKIQENSNDIK